MNRQKFPSWAPQDVVSEWKQACDEVAYWERRVPSAKPDTEQVNMLYRLLTYPDMKSVWEKLPKYSIKATSFASMVQLSSLYIETKPHNLTPREYERWLVEVNETAKKLAELIELSRYDQFLQERYFAEYNKLRVKNMLAHSLKYLDPKVDAEQHAKTEPEYNRWPDLNPGLLSTNLRELASLGSDERVGLLGTLQSSVKLEKPNHPNSKRSYFIKKLTQLIRSETGQPLREIVVKTTATVFDDPTLTERQIIRAAP